VKKHLHLSKGAAATIGFSADMAGGAGMHPFTGKGGADYSFVCFSFLAQMGSGSQTPPNMAACF
jgi:hypothetical protein